MKKIITILSICLFLMAGTSLQGQVLIAKWTFPTGTAGDSLADGGLAVNMTMALRTEGGTSAIDFSKNGFTTKAAQATGWENGAITKCWIVQLNTVGYKELKLSSKQQSGGNNPGPLDYMVQFRTGSAGTWSDVPNSGMLTANNWTSAALDSIILPDSCANRAALYLRWVMTSNVNSTGGALTAEGINKIDDIIITGKQISTIVNDPIAPLTFSLSPNPANGPVTITSPFMISSVEMIDLNGHILFSDQAAESRTITLNPGQAPKGNYLVRIRNKSGQAGVKNLIVK